MSSAESFVLALAQCPQVTTLGDRTAGSSGNPRRVDAGAGIVVNLPRWIDMDPEGKPIDPAGVAPRVKIEAKPEDFRGDRDPVLAAALENLRGRPQAQATPSGGVLKRRPGVPLPKDFTAPSAGPAWLETLMEINRRFHDNRQVKREASRKERVS
jgi:C-terminal processing protease CtpA/Prc